VKHPQRSRIAGWIVLAAGLPLGLPLHAAVPLTAAPARTLAAQTAKPKKTKAAASKAHGHAGAAAKRSASARPGKRTAVGKRETRAAAAARAATTVQAIRLTSAFVASAQLRPMAQQLAASRSPAGYSAVLSYAQTHTGAAAMAADLSLGHAYMLDHRFDEAATAFRRAAVTGDVLSDYADYLGAQALVQGNHLADALPLLDHFADRHPDSIFTVSAPLLEANAYVLGSNGAGAIQVLTPFFGTPEADHADFKLTLGRAYQASGDHAKAIALYRSIYVNQPLSYEATQARSLIASAGSSLTAGERKVHADQLFNAKRYTEAGAEYNAIRNDPSLAPADRDALALYSAVCDLRLKRLSRRDVEKLTASNDDTAALKLYLLAEISRTEKDRSQHDALIAQMLQQYPHSRWFEEALYSGGNMYLLTHDATQAIYHYQLLIEHFPNSVYAPSAHWRDAWMNYRLRRYAEAARLMDEQVVRYGAGIEAPSALYWRGRIYEEHEKNFAQAATYYRALSANYTNYYYGLLARQRLAVLGNQPDVAPTPAVEAVRRIATPELAPVVPESDPHYIKAKLLANAALNEYIGPELAAGAGASRWGALAQAQIYASFGETTRALQSIKRAGISFFALSQDQIPASYWRLMFPQPYWSEVVSDSQRNGLDPYLVASLIRQESEFNASVVSPAHAYGLMQLIPATAKENARKEGLKGFSTGELLNPAINLQLGTRNLRGVLDRFGGQVEYALAAYNAGDVPVRQWMAAGDYQDIAEFVESIPYTETREYVQAILRNREVYRMLYGQH
jgi:soluble lytic murein transglycosylase